MNLKSLMMLLLIMGGAVAVYSQKPSLKRASASSQVSCDLRFYSKYSIKNDKVIVPLSSGCNTEGTFKIVSNNGVEVFVTDKIPFSWDMKYNNNLVEKGKYMWQYTFFNSKRQTNTNFGAFEIIE